MCVCSHLVTFDLPLSDLRKFLSTKINTPMLLLFAFRLPIHSLCSPRPCSCPVPFFPAGLFPTLSFSCLYTLHPFHPLHFFRVCRCTAAILSSLCTTHDILVLSLKLLPDPRYLKTGSPTVGFRGTRLDKVYLLFL